MGYYQGYHQGSVNEKIQRLSFDLSIYLMMHEMGEVIHSSDRAGEISWDPGNTRMLLYATLDFHDKNEKYFEKEKKNSPRFIEGIEKARRITQGMKIARITIEESGAVVDTGSILTIEHKELEK